MVKHIPFYDAPGFAQMAHNDLLFYVASLLGTCGFLRGGEFLAYTRSDRPMLRHRDIVIVEEDGRLVVKVNIVQPKNMWWLESAVVTCFNPPTGGSGLICDLVAALTMYRSKCSVIGLRLSDAGPAL